MNPQIIPHGLNVWVFINAAYAASVFCLAGMSWLTYRRYRRAWARLAQAEQL